LSKPRRVGQDCLRPPAPWETAEKGHYVDNSLPAKTGIAFNRLSLAKTESLSAER